MDRVERQHRILDFMNYIVPLARHAYLLEYDDCIIGLRAAIEGMQQMKQLKADGKQYDEAARLELSAKLYKFVELEFDALEFTNERPPEGY